MTKRAAYQIQFRSKPYLCIGMMVTALAIVLSACTAAVTPAAPVVQTVTDPGVQIDPNVIEGLSGPIFSNQLAPDVVTAALGTYFGSEQAQLAQTQLGEVVYGQYMDQGLELNDLKLSSDEAAPVFTETAPGQFVVSAVMMPIETSSQDMFSEDYLTQLTQTGQNLPVAALVLENGVSEVLPAGSYIAEWLSVENKVCLTDPVTGEQHCGTAAYCEVSSIPGFYVEAFSGSLTFCVKFDDRRCCISI